MRPYCPVLSFWLIVYLAFGFGSLRAQPATGGFGIQPIVRGGTGATTAAKARDNLAVAGPVFNVTAYGAVLDGTTDDTTAIQSAIDATVAAGGGVVYFAGIGKISSALTISSSVGLTLRGGDRNTCGVKLSDQALVTALTITGQNVTIENLKFDGAYTTGASSGAEGLITIDDAKDIIIQNCFVTNSLRNGVLILGDSRRIHLLGTRLERNYCSIRTFPDTVHDETPLNITIQHCELRNNWDLSNNDQASGIKLEGHNVTVESSGHLIDDNDIENVGCLAIELWGGDGVISNSIVSNNRIKTTNPGYVFGISLNGCHYVTAIGNSIRMASGYLGIEVANRGQHVLVEGNNINMYKVDNVTPSTGCVGLIANHNVADPANWTSFIGNQVAGASTSCQIQDSPYTMVKENTFRHWVNSSLFCQGTSHLTVKNNEFYSEGASSFIFIDVTARDVSDIEIGYNTFVGNATYRTFWAYNNNSSHTLTNLRFHHNVADESTFTGYDSWWLGFDANEMINVRRYDNYYKTAPGYVYWPNYSSPDVVIDAPYIPEIQGYSIPVAKRFSIPVTASATDQWFKIYSGSQGFPIYVVLHIFAYFAGDVPDNRNTSVTLGVAASPYGMDASITKFPEGDFHGGVVKEVIYDNSDSWATQEIWIRLGPTAGGSSITIAGADFPDKWILSPTAVTTEPTWATNHYICDLSQHRQFFSRVIASDIFTTSEQASEPAAPPANKVVIFAIDNGSGKTVLKAKFNSGAAQVLATEP